MAGLVVAALGCVGSETRGDDEDDRFSLEVFANPPPQYGPETRWWWPGSAVDADVVRDQLTSFAELGYAAVEIQPFMAGLQRSDLNEDPRIRTVGEAEFLERLHTAACSAQELGLSWDLTFGSGWPTGAMDIDDRGERQLIVAELTLTGPMSFSGPLPTAEEPEWVDLTNSLVPALDGFDEELTLFSVLAAEVVDAPETPPTTLGDIVSLASQVEDGTLTWEVPDGTHRVFATYQNRTLHFPAGNAYPGELEKARVLDHLDREALQAYLVNEFAAWVDAVADCPPRAVFVDSFELIGELPWTTELASKFEAGLQYDVEPLVPFLFLEGGESEYLAFGNAEAPARYRARDDRGERAREDYEAFRGALFAEELLVPLGEWLRERGIQFRLQAHGGYGDVLEAYELADVPESEGLFGGGSYDFLRLAASAGHVGGKRYVSSETFPSLGALSLSEDEARLLMGRAFSAGINRLIYHGNAYRYVQQDGQDWYPFRASADPAFPLGPLSYTFDIHPDADIWPSLPALNAMAARLTYTLSRGSSEAEVAWLYPEWRAENFLNFGANSVMPGAYESETSTALRGAGFVYDRVSRSALAASTSTNGVLKMGQATYRALLIKDVHAVDPKMLEAVELAANAGVPVIWSGDFPERADGLVDAAARDEKVRSVVERLRSMVRVVSSVEQIPVEILSAGVAPSLSPTDSAGMQMSVQHRRVMGGDLYFLFNESYEQRTDRLRVEGTFDEVVLLDPETGEPAPVNLKGDVLAVTLPAVRGIVLWVRRVN